MIFSSAHTDTQDRMVSSNTSITHFWPSGHNIIDIQVKEFERAHTHTHLRTLRLGFHGAATKILSRS